LESLDSLGKACPHAVGEPGDPGVKGFTKEEAMFEQDQIFAQGLVQIVRNLKQAGIEDITTEVVGLHNGNKHMKFRFYTEEQWLANPANIVNTATRLFGKTYKGKYKMPDHLVTYEKVQYFVVIV